MAEKVHSVHEHLVFPKREKRIIWQISCFPSPRLFILGWVLYWQATLPEAGQVQRRLVCLSTLIPPARSNRVYYWRWRNRVPRASNSKAINLQIQSVLVDLFLNKWITLVIQEKGIIRLKALKYFLNIYKIIIKLFRKKVHYLIITCKANVPPPVTKNKNLFTFLFISLLI